MRTLAPALATHLASGVTTLASCWKLTRRDGGVLGFTDHDRDLTFDGVTFEAAAGFTSTDIKSSIGLSVDNLDVASAVTSARLDDVDLASGLYDDASVEIWRVNWSDPAQRILERKGSIGEVRRSGAHFSAEIRGIAHYLNQPKGRLYQFSCDADLGDARCAIVLNDPTITAPATVTVAVDQRCFIVSGLGSYAADWFTRGLATVATGIAAGARSEIRRHTKSGGADRIELWQPLATPLSIGDQLSVIAGCDKAFASCQAKFDNTVNFRGFPHIPGNGFVTTVARQGDTANDGASLR